MSGKLHLAVSMEVESLHSRCSGAAPHRVDMGLLWGVVVCLHSRAIWAPTHCSRFCLLTEQEAAGELHIIVHMPGLQDFPFTIGDDDLEAAAYAVARSNYADENLQGLLCNKIVKNCDETVQAWNLRELMPLLWLSIPHPVAGELSCCPSGIYSFPNPPSQVMRFPRVLCFVSGWVVCAYHPATRGAAG